MKKTSALAIGKKNSHQPAFYKKVFAVVATIPPGQVSTYKDVAKACGSSRGSRAVGNALHCNKDTDKVPCHRVVRSDARIGGYAGGKKMKRKLLVQEGIVIEDDLIANIHSYSDAALGVHRIALTELVLGNQKSLAVATGFNSGSQASSSASYYEEISM